MNRQVLEFFIILFLLLINRSDSYAQNRQELKTEQFIVTFKQKPKVIDLIGISQNKKKSRMKYAITESKSMVYEVSEGNLTEAINEMKQDSNIESVVPDKKLDLLYLPNDTGIRSTPAAGKPQIQWSMFNLNLVGSGRSAWDISKGSSQIVVAVMDSGIDSNHEDLQGKLISLVNCAGNSCQTVSSMTANPTSLDESHGTHVAGTIGAATDNNKGLAGAGFNTPLMILKVRNTNGEMLISYFINAIRYAADHNIKIINMSVGGLVANLDGPIITQMDDAISYAWNKGLLLVAAAGNCGRPASSHQSNGDPCDVYNASGNFVRHAVNEKYYPAANPKVISVAALDINNNLASYSESNDPGNPQIGNWISVAAPGGDFSSISDKEWGIASTWPSNQYFYDIGTSMATPHVSGIAALIWAYKPTLTNAQVKSVIENTGNRNIIAGKTKFGMINALAALDSLGTVSPFPTLTPTAGAPSLTPTFGAVFPSLSPTVDISPPIPTSASIIPTAGTCNNQPQDASCYSLWVFEYTGVTVSQFTDFNQDNIIDLIDYEIWRRANL